MLRWCVIQHQHTLGNFVNLTRTYLVYKFPQNTTSPDGHFVLSSEHMFHPHTNSSSAYFQLSVVHGYIPFFQESYWYNLNQTAIPHILYYLSCILCLCNCACTICISQKRIETRTKTFKKRKWCRDIDAAHWQTKHRNKLHVGMVLTGIQSTETSCM